MTAVTPPLYLNVDSFYGAKELGLPFRDLVGEGVLTVASNALKVSQRGAGANMSVDVAAGSCWVKGDDSALQPLYRCYNDGTVNVAVTTSDPTNPRIDRVIAEVRDATFSGSFSDWRIRIVAGTPAGSPSAPALPNNAISLATIAVGAAVSSIVTANITDLRANASIGAGDAPLSLLLDYSTTLPTSPVDRQEHILVDSITVPTYQWRFRYNAGSAQTDKWEFVGGSPALVEITTAETTTSTSYVALSTAGPNFALPRAGVYMVENGFKTGGGNEDLAIMSFDIGGTGAVDGDSVQGRGGGFQTGSFSTDNSPSRSRVKAGLTAVTLTSKYKSSGGGTARFSNRWLKITPVRVS